MVVRSTKVFVILLSTALFLGIIVPIYIAPKAFYNGLPIVTTLVPLAVLLAFVLSIGALLYYIFERKADQRRIGTAK